MEEILVSESNVITEFEQSVLSKLDEILVTIPDNYGSPELLTTISNQLSHIYALLLFVVGVGLALIVLILLYKFLLRSFY